MKHKKDSNIFLMVRIIGDIINNEQKLMSVKNVDKQQQKDIETSLSIIEKFLNKEVKEIFANENELFKFSYHLRVYDAKNANTEDFYTNKILDRIPEIEPLFKEILMSNKLMDEEMKVDPAFTYNMKIGNKNPKYILNNEK